MCALIQIGTSSYSPFTLPLFTGTEMSINTMAVVPCGWHGNSYQGNVNF